MTLSHSNGSYHFASQSTFQMYWGLASDLWAVSQNTTLIGGQSLIRTSGSYAFANKSMFTLLAQNGTLVTPLGAAFTLVQSTIGPFGSIDMRNIPCPASVKHFVAAGLEVLRRTLITNMAAMAGYLQISGGFGTALKAFPTTFTAAYKWLGLGGSILCPEYVSGDYVLTGLVKLTGRAVVCGQKVITLLSPSKSNGVVAAIASGLSQPDVNISEVCAHETTQIDCATKCLGPTASFIQAFISQRDTAELRTAAAAALVDVWSLNATILQYVQANSTLPLQMFSYKLFDPADPTFTFWAWLHVLEWAVGQREVVRFEGDVGYMNLITEVQPSLRQNIQPHEFPTTMALYIRTGVQYVTGVLLGIAVGIALYILASEGSVEASNLMKMNRVAGIVWVGRPLLLLRGVTALALLSTGTLELHLKDNFLSHFRVVDVPWYKTTLAAGESTWLVYIINDLLMVWTKEEFTPLYASTSSLFTWLVVAILTLAMPVVHHATVAPTCHVDHVDFQVVCASGVVVIGQVTRFYWLLGIVAFVNVVCYLRVRIFHRRLGDTSDASKASSLLLCAGAKFLFHRSDWLHGNVYCLDPASALMNGLVSLRWRQFICIFDIKLWRTFVIEKNIQDTTPPHMWTALALTE
ncbi:Aste57867_20234 [Aphanomyces stellatus]|uniref:Aste57867_20234 protein n=1 Tax=Aphanomyces stellatus TaxID=120398 RepID=A0A485LF39_9STRA|nr:hypothetical protein As57867_020168 [Aphanomyces stellatus]VFT96925.1 Aste57867_20234 [Aphanomyces stellatus]